MAYNRGKQFEAKFKNDWINTIPDSFCIRIPDQMNGFYNSGNICDFICYKHPKLFLLELKSIEGNTFPWSNFTQYEKMVPYIDIPGVISGIIIWMRSHDKEYFIPLTTIKKMKENNIKSFNIKEESNLNYPVVLIPTKVKRVFLDADYCILTQLGELKNV